MRTFISVEEALDEVLSTCSLVSSEFVALGSAAGRVLAEEVHADSDHPRFDNSAVDGYVVSAADLDAPGITLTVAGELQAGSHPVSPVLPGSCWRIMTGAALPPGAAAVIPVEESSVVDEDRIRLEKGVGVGANVRLAGQDVRAGELVLPRGTPIGAAASGLLAMFGRARVRVARRPRIAIVSTGNELVSPEDMPGPGQLRNSNATALAAQAMAAGAEIAGLYHARDTADEIDAVITRARESDVLVFTGGVSVGRYDLVHDALQRAGLVTNFWKVRQRPGKPMLFGTLDGVPTIGLPGNPVSSSVCFDQYVRPAIHRMTGRETVLRPRFTARLASSFPKPEGLHVFARGIAGSGAGGTLEICPTGAQGSHVFSSVLRANCLVHLPADWAEAPAGSLVEAEWVDW